jgi:hypothetical protein
MAERIRIIRIIPRAFPTRAILKSGSRKADPASISIGTTIPVEPRSHERWIGMKRGKPHAPLRAPSAPSRNTSAHCAMAAAGFAKRIPISHGKGRTPAPVARPAHLAIIATVPPTSRCGCRKDLNRMRTKSRELPPKMRRHGWGPTTEAGLLPGNNPKGCPNSGRGRRYRQRGRDDFDPLPNRHCAVPAGFIAALDCPST